MINKSYFITFLNLNYELNLNDDDSYKIISLYQEKIIINNIKIFFNNIKINNYDILFYNFDIKVAEISIHKIKTISR